MTTYLTAGFMSGTSLDGVDVAIIKTDGYLIEEQIAFTTYPYSPEFKQKMKSILGSKQYNETIKSIENELTEVHYKAISDLCKKDKIDMNSINLIGFHGQTIYHKSLLMDDIIKNKENSDEKSIDDSKESNQEIAIVKGKNCQTWQIGDAKLLFDKLKIPIVYDLRYNDVLNGGQGAPLAPIYHAAIAITQFVNDIINNKNSKLKFPVVFINIGGISNVTFIDFKEKNAFDDAKQKIEADKPGFVKSLYDNLILKAFDIGPGNCILDDWIGYATNNNDNFDKDGKYSMNGCVDDKDMEWFINQFMSHSYFNIKPPKSLDRNDLHNHLWKVLGINNKYKQNFDYVPVPKICNIAQIIGQCTCYCIVQQITKYCCNDDKSQLPATWLICGGGRKNPFIMKNIRKYCNMNDKSDIKSVKVMDIEEFGYNGDAIEAQAWAFLAARSKQDIYISTPETTGVSTQISGGQLLQ